MSYFCSFLVMLSTVFSKADPPKKLVVCGDSKVMIIEQRQPADTVPNILWVWDAKTATDIPLKYSSTYFKTVDECKPVDNGKRIVITSSAGGVAVLERATNKVLFYAYVPNAHSAELLPGNRLVVAGSGTAGSKGNCIELFDMARSEKSLYKDTLYQAHGVIWNDKTKTLLALGYSVLNQYNLSGWQSDTPRLQLKQAVQLPDQQGHELQRYKNDTTLMLSTHGHVWLYNIKQNVFQPFAPLQNKVDVKSLSYQKRNQMVSYTVAEESWWTHHVYFVGSDQFLSLPDLKMYKAHWID